MRTLAGIFALVLMAATMACDGGAAAPSAAELPAAATATVGATATMPAPTQDGNTATPAATAAPARNDGAETVLEPTPERVVVETPVAAPDTGPTDTPTPSATPTRVPTEFPGQPWPVRVESVSVVPAGDGFTLRVVSVLPHYCYRIAGHDVAVEGDKLLVTLTAVDDSKTQAIACAQAEKEVVTDIPLGEELRRGRSYTVVVNGDAVTTFAAP